MKALIQGTSDQFMNSYLALRKASFCITDFRNSSLLRAIRCLESVISERNLFRPELISDALVKDTKPVSAIN